MARFSARLPGKRRGGRMSVALAVVATLVTPPLAAADQAVQDIVPWEPYPNPPVCGMWGCTDEAPVMPTQYPTPRPLPTPPAGGWSAEHPPPRTETLWWTDFDKDSVPNWADNCVLVPNTPQTPAVKPPGAPDPVSPSAHQQAVEWKSQNPGAMYRLASEVGEACSDYNDNWRRSAAAFRVSSQDRKVEIFKFLSQGGPMFGENTLVLAVPTVSSLAVILQIADWHLGLPLGTIESILKTLVPKPILDQFSPSTGKIVRPLQELGQSIWTGKRIFTPTNEGGMITNRFFYNFTESEWFKPFIMDEPWLFPGGTGQTVTGHFRADGKSVWDGRQQIGPDWRAATGAGIGNQGNRWPITDQRWQGDLFNFLPQVGEVCEPTGPFCTVIQALPIAFGTALQMVPGIKQFDSNYLIHDSCRGLQEGFTVCTAEIAFRMVDNPNRAHWFQEGWMPFQTVDASVENQRAWQLAHPMETEPEYYNLPTNNGFDQ